MNFGKRKLPSSLSVDDVGSSTEPISDDTVKRKFRNLNEKKRRDQFNMLINELSAIVCSPEARRVDKTTVLEQAIQFLENHQAIEINLNENISYNWKPSFLSPDEFSYLLLEAMDCVTLAIDDAGIIKYLSENAMSKLGIAQDTVNKERRLQEFLAEPEACEMLLNSARDQPNKLAKVEALLACDESIEDRRFQSVNLLCVPEGDTNNHLSYTEDSMEKSYNCIVKLKSPVLTKEHSWVSSDVVFKGKYSLEWKILHIDSKAAAVLGYQPYEMLGSSGYDFYHPQDIDLVAASHKRLVKSGCCTTPYHRMLTKSQGWVWLQSDLYMSFNQWSGKPEHVDAVHRVVRCEDVEIYKCSGQNPDMSNRNNPKRARLTSPLTLTHPSAPFKHKSNNRDVFSHQLADIGVNKNREIKFGRLPQEHYLDAASVQAAPAIPIQPTLLTPKYLTPIQTKLHQQLQMKYKDLKANLDRQQAELDELVKQLNLSALMKPLDLNSNPSSVQPPPPQQQQQQLRQQIQKIPNQTLPNPPIYKPSKPGGGVISGGGGGVIPKAHLQSNTNNRNFQITVSTTTNNPNQFNPALHSNTNINTNNHIALGNDLQVSDCVQQ